MLQTDLQKMVRSKVHRKLYDKSQYTAQCVLTDSCLDTILRFYHEAFYYTQYQYQVIYCKI